MAYVYTHLSWFINMIYIYIFIIQYSLVGGFNPSEKKTTLSQLGLSFPKYGVTVIQTTS